MKKIDRLLVENHHLEREPNGYPEGDVSGIIIGSIAHDISPAHIVCETYAEAAMRLGLRAAQADTVDHSQLACKAKITDPYVMSLRIGDMNLGLAMQYRISPKCRIASTFITLDNAAESRQARLDAMKVVSLLHRIVDSYVLRSVRHAKIDHCVLNDLGTSTNRWV